MTNDLTTVDGSFQQLIDDLENNLQAMGVTNAQFNSESGIRGLASKILDIEPSVNGLELNSTLTLNSSKNTISLGESVIFQTKLSVSYDDESIENIDLSGVLTGATVGFYSGDTLLGTSVTDVNGVATFTHVFNDIGVFSVHSVFSGTENFDSCVSSNVTINVNYGLSVSSDKSAISYYDKETTNITCNVFDGNGGVSGKTVFYQISKNNGNILDSGSDVTDNNGNVSIEYVSSGIGDVSILFVLDSQSKIYNIEDCLYYNDGTNLLNIAIGNGVSCTVSDGALRITKSTNGEGYVTIPQILNKSDNFVLEWEIACEGTSQRTAFWLNNATTATGFWCTYESGHFGGAMLGTLIPVTTTSLNVGDKIYLKQKNNVITILKNNETIFSRNVSFSVSSYRFGYYTNSGRVQCVDNIKIKPL